MTARFFRYSILLLLPLFLSACGDGWEMIRTDTMFPYGNQRTAGSGVAYVRANMLPERPANLEPAQPAPVAVPAPAPVPEAKIEEIFEKKQQK